MIHLCYSNRTEALLEALVERVGARASPLDPLVVVVPNRHLERYVDIGVARALGVSANLRFVRLERFVRDWLSRASGEHTVLDAEQLEALVLSVLLDPAALDTPELAPVRAYLDAAGSDDDARDVRRVQLASRLARIYEEYGFSRFEMLDAWARGTLVLSGTAWAVTETWQRALLLRARQAARELGAPDMLLHEALARSRAPEPPQVVHVFGVSYVARVFQRVLGVIAAQSELFVYTLNPCEEFWEDVAGISRRSPHAATSPAAADGESDPFGLLTDADTPLLRLWGRPGRESIRLLNELGGGDFDPRFVDPASAPSPTLLEQVQHDVLVRAPLPAVARAAADESIRVLACPGPRREVEAVVEEIWRAIRADAATRAPGAPPLRFNEIAVLIDPSQRDVYLPHVDAVFRAAHDVPHHVVDVPFAAESRVVSAALLLVALPLGSLTRPEVLDVITHPSVLSRSDEVDPLAWVDLVESLGVFRGADRTDLAGTYVERDLWTWDQGMKRLALGRLLEAQRSGEGRAYETGADRYFPQDLAAVSDTRAAELLLLVRSLVADACFARGSQLPLSRWAAFLREALLAYITPTDEGEHAELRRCLGVLAAIGERPFGERPVRYRVAAELVRGALEGLTGGRGEYLADGVVVSTFQPMRAIPFRQVFLVGLGEGHFPAADRRDTLDLRGARRMPGDVSPPERDRYACLETLCCARERLVITYTSRDAEAGEPLAWSPVVEELLGTLDRGYVPSARKALVEKRALRRWDDAGAAQSAIASVRRELRAVALGAALRPRPGVALELERVRAALGDDWDAAADLLGHCSPPEAAPPLVDDGGALRLSLSALRAFLECPLQGWARAVLHVAADDDDDARSAQDEPLEPSLLDSAAVLRGVLLDARRDGVAPMTAHARAVERLEASGRWPTGVVGAARAERDQTTLDGWARELASRAGGVEPMLVRLRFGPGQEHDRADELAPAIALEIVDPRPDAGGRALRVELGGLTEAWASAPRAAVVLAVTRPSDKNARVCAEWRLALRAFFDHVALAASGREPDVAHAAWVLQPDGTSAAFELAAISQSDARAWLCTLVQELLARPHAYFLPCEVPMLAWHKHHALTDDSIAFGLDTTLDDLHGGRSRYGPVPDAPTYAPPSPDDALTMLERRFGPFFARTCKLADDGAQA